MEMSHYSDKLVDPKKNIFYGSTQREAFITFTHNPLKNYPVRVEMIGITHPDKDYYIERKHGDYFVLEYVASGYGYVKTDSGNYKVGPDSVYLLHPGKGHSYGADKNNPYEKIWINFFSSIFTDIIAAYEISDKTVFPDSGCKDLFNELLEIAQVSSDNDEVSYDVSEILFRIIIKLAKNSAVKSNVSAVASIVKESLDSRIYRQVSIEDLSKELNISKSQIEREFKKYFGISPYQYILDKKTDVARHILRATSMRIYEISELLGFSDTYYFSNLFKEKTGMSPMAYRTKYRDNLTPPPQ